MKKAVPGRYVFLFFGLLTPILLRAQKAMPANLLEADSLTQLSWYDQSIGLENTELRTGTLYKGQRKARLGNPYFKTDNWVRGSLEYRNQYFDEVELLYDISEDVLVIKGSDILSSGKLIGLNREQVKRFTLSGSTFVYVANPLDIYLPGYYELVYSGSELRFLAKRTKYVDIDAQNESEYKVRDKYFVYLHGEYHLLRGKRSIFRLTPELKKLLKQFVKLKRLRLLKSGHDNHLKEFGAFWEEQLK